MPANDLESPLPDIECNNIGLERANAALKESIEAIHRDASEGIHNMPEAMPIVEDAALKAMDTAFETTNETLEVKNEEAKTEELAKEELNLSLDDLKTLLVASYYPETFATDEEIAEADANWDADYACAYILSHGIYTKKEKELLDILKPSYKKGELAAELQTNDNCQLLWEKLQSVPIPLRPITVAELDEILHDDLTSEGELTALMNLAMQGNLCKRSTRSKPVVGASDKLERWQIAPPEFIFNRKCIAELLPHLERKFSLFKDYTKEIEGNFCPDWSDRTKSLRLCILGSTLASMKQRLNYAYKKITQAIEGKSPEEIKALLANKKLVVLGSERIVSKEANEAEYEQARADLETLVTLYGEDTNVKDTKLQLTGGKTKGMIREWAETLLSSLEKGEATEGDMAKLALVLAQLQHPELSQLQAKVLVAPNDDKGHRANTNDTIMRNLEDMQDDLPAAVYYVTTQPNYVAQIVQIEQANKQARTAKEVPDATLKVSDTTLKVSDTTLKVSDTTLKVSDTTLKVSDATPKVPDTVLKVPDTTLIAERFTVIPDPNINPQLLEIRSEAELTSLQKKADAMTVKLQQQYDGTGITDIEKEHIEKKLEGLKQIQKVDFAAIRNTQNRLRILFQAIASSYYAHCPSEYRPYVGSTAVNNARTLFSARIEPDAKQCAVEA